MIRCTTCNGPVAKVFDELPCVVPIQTARGNWVRCGLRISPRNDVYSGTRRPPHKADFWYMHVAEHGRCGCGHPEHGPACAECGHIEVDDAGHVLLTGEPDRLFVARHQYASREKIEADHDVTIDVWHAWGSISHASALSDCFDTGASRSPW